MSTKLLDNFFRLTIYLNNNNLEEYESIIPSSDGPQALYRFMSITELRLHALTEEALLQTQTNDHSHDINICAVLGVPREMNMQDVLKFIDPYLIHLKSIDMLSLLSEDVILDTYSKPIDESSSSAIKKLSLNNILLLDFRNEELLESFISVYNNLHFPSVDDAAPCAVIRIANIIYSKSIDMNAIKSNDINIDVVGLQLPYCTVCLRRIKASISNVPGIHDLHPNLWSAGAGGHARCKTCYIYSSYEADKHSSNIDSSAYWNPPQSALTVATMYTKNNLVSKNCNICGIKENIWVCLICGHTGCGRYTAQHAKLHFEDSKHPFALELASGRIWNYDQDTFSQIEQESNQQNQSEYSSSSQFQFQHPPPFSPSTSAFFSSSHSSQSPSPPPLHHDLNTYPYAAAASSPMHTVHKAQTHSQSQRMSQTFNKPILYSSSEQRSSRAAASTVGMEDEEWRNNNNHLNNEIHRKMDSLIDYYERLLVTTLRDQEIYYEKLLAKETVKLLEKTHKLHLESSTAVPASSNDNIHCEGSVLWLNLPSPSDDAMTSAFVNEIDIDDDFEFVTEEQSNVIEALKIEISALEQESVVHLEELKHADQHSREIRKQNETLIKEQKINKENLAALIAQELDVNTRCQEQIADYEQQINDLKFYARSKVQLSPYQGELEGSQVYISQSNNANNNSSSSTRRKRVGKKK